MSVRQRLRTRFEISKVDRLCWRCALGLRRHNSSVQQLGNENPFYKDLLREQKPGAKDEYHKQLRNDGFRVRYIDHLAVGNLVRKTEFKDQALRRPIENAASASPISKTGSSACTARLTSFTEESANTPIPPKISKHLSAPNNQLHAIALRRREAREPKGKEEKPDYTQGAKHDRSRIQYVGSSNIRRINNTSLCKNLHGYSHTSISHAPDFPNSFEEKGGLNVQAPKRQYATNAYQSSLTNTIHDPAASDLDSRLKATLEGGDIREHLRLWRQQPGLDVQPSIPTISTSSNLSNDFRNIYTQSPEDDNVTAISPDSKTHEVEDERIEFDSDDPTSNVLKHEIFLRRGDLVEVQTPIDPILAIFIQNVDNQIQLYTMRGQWLHRETWNVRFCVPGFVNPDELDAIMPYLPSTEVAKELIDRLQPLDVSAPRGAGARLLEKMSLFYRAADDVFRKNADRLNRTYELIAPSHANTGKVTMNLGQIAMTVLQKKSPAELSPVMMWAVHRALVKSQNVALEVINSRQNVLYEIHPARSLSEIAQVRDWMREFQEGVVEKATEFLDVDIDQSKVANPIAQFIDKARAAIKHSRRTRSLAPNGCLGPSTVRIKPDEAMSKAYRNITFQEFSQDEKVIIHYLDAWVTSRYLNPFTNLSALGPMILRAVDLYDDLNLDQVVGCTFLQEIGIISPWENHVVYRQTGLKLPDHDTGTQEITQLQRKAYKDIGVPAVLPKDSMEGLRHDWGNLAVFCIDSAGTLDRDDGVSIEPIEGSQSEQWIHIHVANPSAFITPGSATAKYAAQLWESVYFPERKYPMIHPSLTLEHLSLGNGRPCLTFSARMTTEGDLLDKKITPGIVNNVHHVTPFQVGRELGMLGSEESESIPLVTVGGELPVMSMQESNQVDEPIAPSHVAMLRKLFDLSEAVRRRRTRNGAPDFYSSATITSVNPKVFLGTQVEPFRLNDQAFGMYEGDPSIAIERTTASFGLVTKRVSNLMILAGEVAASWCMERSIPIPYRGIIRNPEPASSPDAFRETVIEPQIAKYGSASQMDLVNYMRLIGLAGVSASPLEHFALGLPAYCKATSPLRRYLDLYTHWQIDAALRHEAQTGTSLIGDNSTDNSSYLAFSHSEVEELGASDWQQLRRISNAKAGSVRHWIVQALFRAFYFQEAPLPETFELTILMPYENYHYGWLNLFNLRTTLTGSDAVDREGGVQVGDLWEAKMMAVDTYHKTIEMKPVRLIERRS